VRPEGLGKLIKIIHLIGSRSRDLPVCNKALTTTLRRAPKILWLLNHKCKIRGFYGSNYEEGRPLGYKNPVRTSQETHYISATNYSRLMQCKI
jgi:hypothetical protein